jgi:predicted RNase H-like nuclease
MINILGVDAAWTEKNSSGIALLQFNPEDDTLLLKSVASSYEDFTQNSLQKGIVDFPFLLNYCKNTLSTPVDIISLDIPLAHYPITSRRKSDQEISVYFGGRGASAHSPNSKYPGITSTEIYEQLSELGYSLSTKDNIFKSKTFIETYPHPVIIRYLKLDYRLAYKVAKRKKYYPDDTPQVGNEKVKNTLIELWEYLAARISNINLIFPKTNLNTISPSQLKKQEDILDAIICCLVGVDFHIDNVDCFGDKDAAIWIQKNSKTLK